MNWKNRVLRFALALAVAGAIAMQIPNRGGVALAVDEYGGSGGGGARTLIQATVFALVGYGIYSTIAGGGLAPVPGSTVPTDIGDQPGDIPPAATQGDPIWQVANKTADLKQFAEASEQAGLKDTLMSPGQYTAFIPTNNAFGIINPEVLAALMTEENKAKLADIIGFHVVQGTFTIEQLKADATAAGVNGLTLNTITGKTVIVTNDNGLKLNGVPVVEQDIQATNGVIHPLTAVLMPDQAPEPAQEAPVTPPTPPAGETPPPASEE